MSKRHDDQNKGKYEPLPEEEDENTPQPPIYSPFAAGSSVSPLLNLHPLHQQHQQQLSSYASPSHSSTPNPASPSAPLLYPHLQDDDPSPPQQHQYQQPNPHQHPPPSVPHQEATTHAGIRASPLILMRPPTKIEDLKAKPAVVVCQHCRHLVFTETSPEI
ncbi:hypothetical protein BGZ83_002712, partial [Gryganskiella cystojenkinii]